MDHTAHGARGLKRPCSRHCAARGRIFHKQQARQRGDTLPECLFQKADPFLCERAGARALPALLHFMPQPARRTLRPIFPNALLHRQPGMFLGGGAGLLPGYCQATARRHATIIGSAYLPDDLAALLVPRLGQLWSSSSIPHC